MAITRRQFVTRLGTLAAAAGFSQAQASQIMDALAYSPTTKPGSTYQGTFGKPRVVWIHGAECTGCSTSLLGIFENKDGTAIEGAPYTIVSNPSLGTTGALDLAGTLPTNHTPVANDAGLLLHDTGVTALVGEPEASINIADVVIDVLDIIYHETIMGMGGDLAYSWLKDFATNNAKPYVLVVEGALQNKQNLGAWAGTGVGKSWCSIGMDGDNGIDAEIDMPDMTVSLASSVYCVAVIAIGQCACFGGYPGCKPPITEAVAGFDVTKSQTQAMGTFDYLSRADSYTTIAPWTVPGSYVPANVAAKVINVPGCPTNPWWFVLSVVAFLVDAPQVMIPPYGVGVLGTSVGPLKVLKTAAATNTNNATALAVNLPAVDSARRLKAVYGNPIHGINCERMRYYTQGIYALAPGDAGCLQKIGCKGMGTRSLCGTHGWNNQQPQNAGVAGFGTTPIANTQANLSEPAGGHCTRAGHPCMACTEKGYPDSYVPFVVR